MPPDIQAINAHNFNNFAVKCLANCARAKRYKMF